MPTLSFREIERRADEALSGKVKMISALESKFRIDRLIAAIRRDRLRSGILRLPIAAAIIMGLFAATTRAAEERPGDQKVAYQALVAQFPSIEKSFKSEAERQSWHKFVTSGDPVHVRITRVSNFLFRNEYAQWVETDGRSGKFLRKKTSVQPDSDDVWRVQVFGEMTPSVNSIAIFISTRTKQVLAAYYFFGE